MQPLAEVHVHPQPVRPEAVQRLACALRQARQLGKALAARAHIRLPVEL